jgi:hypothetical protein
METLRFMDRAYCERPTPLGLAGSIAIARPSRNQHDLQAQAAVAAVAYAIARGDRRRVQDFSSVDISGIVV